MRPNRLHWVCALFALVAGVGVFRPVTANPEVMARGLAVYQSYYCGACHQLDAAGSKGVFGPPHNAMGVIA